MNDPTLPAEYLKHYELLKSIGVLDRLESCGREIKTLEEIISQAIEIFAKNNLDELISFLVDGFMQKAIPSYLCFIIEDQRVQGKLHFAAFRNLKPLPMAAPINSLSPYREFFHRYPNSISFSLFEYQVDDPALSGPFEFFNPDILAPIMGKRGLYGLVVFGKKIIEGEYNERDISYISRIITFFSISLQNNLHYYDSMIDLKTGLCNHDHFLRRLESELSLVCRHERRCAVLLLDVDHFKLFNDRYGHLAGDTLLQALADLLKSMVRKSDVAARFGGEEFILLLVETGKDAALLAAERIRRAVEALRVEHNGFALSVTVSIGVRAVDRWNARGQVQLIEEADEALYQAKRQGRNRVHLFQGGLLDRARLIRHGGVQ